MISHFLLGSSRGFWGWDGRSNRNDGRHPLPNSFPRRPLNVALHLRKKKKKKQTDASSGWDPNKFHSDSGCENCCGSSSRSAGGRRGISHKYKSTMRCNNPATPLTQEAPRRRRRRNKRGKSGGKIETGRKCVTATARRGYEISWAVIFPQGANDARARSITNTVVSQLRPCPTSRWLGRPNWPQRNNNNSKDASPNMLRHGEYRSVWAGSHVISGLPFLAHFHIADRQNNNKPDESRR